LKEKAIQSLGFSRMMEMFVMDDCRMAANDVVINNQVLRLVINLDRSPKRLELISKQLADQRKLFKNPCSQAELNKIVPFGFSLQRQKMVFFLPSK